MAERRMFSLKVLNSGKFLKMPIDAQNLYFHLGLRADDDGVVEAYPTMRLIGSAEDNLRVLVAKEFVKILNEDLVSFIVDWHEHNKIRPDRKIDSIYKDLLLEIVPDVVLLESRERADSHKHIARTSNGRQMVSIGEVRLGKDRIDREEQPKEDTLPKKVKHPGTGLAMSATRYSALCDKHGAATVDDYMERIQLYCESKPRKPYADAAATAATWIRKDIDKGTFRGIQSYDYDEDIKKKTAYFGAKD